MSGKGSSLNKGGQDDRSGNKSVAMATPSSSLGTSPASSNNNSLVVANNVSAPITTVRTTSKSAGPPPSAQHPQLHPTNDASSNKDEPDLSALQQRIDNILGNASSSRSRSSTPASTTSTVNAATGAVAMDLTTSPQGSPSGSSPPKVPKLRYRSSIDVDNTISSKLTAAELRALLSAPNLPPIVPNGSTVDVAPRIRHLSVKRVMALIPYLVSLNCVDTNAMDVDAIRTYLVINDLPLADDMTSVEGRVYLRYRNADDFAEVEKHKFAFGTMAFSGYDPTGRKDRFYRHMAACRGADPHDTKLFDRTAAVYRSYGIRVTSIAPSASPSLYKIYAEDEEDHYLLGNKALDGGGGALGSSVVIPPETPGGRRVTFTIINSMAFTNREDFYRLHVSIPFEVDPDALLEAIRAHAEDGGHDPKSAFIFGIHRNKKTGRPARFGFLSVKGEEAANYFLSTPLITEEGKIKFSDAAEEEENGAAGKRKRD